MFADILGPHLTPAAFQDATVADIGSGTGRVVDMLLKAGAGHVTAVEPSDAFLVLQKNVSASASRVTCVQVPGDRIPDGPYDFVVSFGVLHHIPDPEPVVARAFDVLKSGGRLVVWLYGREGNGLYLFAFKLIHGVTRRLPDWMLHPLSHVLTAALWAYAKACRVLPLPMRGYMRRVIGQYRVAAHVPDRLRPVESDLRQVLHAR